MRSRLCSARSRRSRRCSTAATIPTSASAAATSPTSSAGCAANLRAGERSARPLPRTRRTARARRRRAHAVGDRAARLAPARRAGERRGSWTYHTAILARSIRIPAVAGLRNASALIAPGSTVARRRHDRRAASSIRTRPTTVADPGARAPAGRLRAVARGVPPAAGRHRRRRRDPARGEHRVADDAQRARERGADGIGLFRSEFLLAGGGQAALTEEAQYAAYSRLLDERGARRRSRSARSTSAKRSCRSSTPASTARGRRSVCAGSA